MADFCLGKKKKPHLHPHTLPSTSFKTAFFYFFCCFCLWVSFTNHPHHLKKAVCFFFYFIFFNGRKSHRADCGFLFFLFLFSETAELAQVSVSVSASFSLQKRGCCWGCQFFVFASSHWGVLCVCVCVFQRNGHYLFPPFPPTVQYIHSLFFTDSYHR